MQQISRTCQVADHDSEEIQYVCVHPSCQLSRFLCPKCLLGTSHQHNQLDNSHVVDNRKFYEKISKNVNQAKGKQLQVKYDIEKSIVPLKQQKEDIQNLLKNIQNIIQQVELGKLQDININHLEDHLLDVQKYGFNKIDDQSLDSLISLPEQLQDFDIYKQLEYQANTIIQSAFKIKEWRLQEVEIKQSLPQSLSQKIKDAKYQIQLFDDAGDNSIYTGAISNDLKYVVSGGKDKLLKIWDYQTKKLIKQIELNFYVISCKFTEDSTLLYAGSDSFIYQFDVQNQFKELYKQVIHDGFIINIYCINNKKLLTSSDNKTIIITDVDKQQQLFKIQAHNDCINGLDYNKSLNIIASGSDDKSIKFLNANDGSLIIQKLNAHNNDQICVPVTGEKFIKVYSIEGGFVMQFDHQFDDIWFYNTIQHNSMKAVLMQRKNKLQVCEFEMD